jgi:hypothetical protein
MNISFLNIKTVGTCLACLTDVSHVCNSYSDFAGQMYGNLTDNTRKHIYKYPTKYFNLT